MKKNRKLQFYILTVFLSLICLSSVFIITFTYKKTYKAILDHSKGTIQKLSTIISERVKCLSQDMEQLTATGTGLFSNLQNFSLENKELDQFMLNILKYYPETYAFFAGDEKGRFIQAIRIALGNTTHFISDPSKPLPENSEFALRFVDRSVQPPVEQWVYKNAGFETTGSETIANSTFDARGRPWYKSAKEGRRLIWTDTYLYQPFNIPGITVAKPAFTPLGELIAVVGVDLTLSELSSFLSHVEIGSEGAAFLLNTKGEIVVAPAISYPKELVDEVYKESQIKSEKEFVIASAGIDYLASISVFPVTFTQTWLIAVIVPLREFFGEMLDNQRFASIISLGILIFSGLLIVFFSRRISQPIVELSEEVNKIKNLDFEGEINLKSNIKEINLIVSSVKSMKAAIHLFARYVPKEIAGELIRKGQDVQLKGAKKEITYFFLDIEGFTQVTESLPIEKLMALLSEYFEGLSRIILQSQGTIDKYMGDNIMAFWGAPKDIPDHSEKACTAALLAQVFISQFNQKQKSAGSPEFRARIGIHEGAVIVGNFGTHLRINYTVMGDVVSISSSLESLSRVYHTRILISEDVRQKLSPAFVVRPLDILDIEEWKKKLTIFDLMAKRDDEASIAPSSELTELSAEFTQAFTLYHEGKLPEAKALFESLRQRFPEDYPTQLYLERIYASLS